jgi:glutamyl-tRNA reductase
MTLHVIGLNHRTAPLAIRERLVFGDEARAKALPQLALLPGVQGAALLSTCNRTELYAAATPGDEVVLRHWLARWHHFKDGELAPYLYQHGGEAMVRHLLRVASGLDSMVLGEPQVLGQLKSAYTAAREAHTLGPVLNRLFQHTFSVAKRVRSDTRIGSSPVSVAYAAVTLARRIFADLAQQTALLIGAGETIELVARHLHDNGVGRMIVANRSYTRAHDLAAQYGAYAIDLRELPRHLAEADMVIASTASPVPIVLADDMRLAMRRRRHRPVFMVDLAVPRDIDPAVGRMEDIYLYTVDDLNGVIEEGLRTRQEAAAHAEEMLDVHVARFMGWLAARDATPAIRALRGRGLAMQQEVLQKAQRLLRQGRDPQAVMNYLAHTLANKLLHTPCARMREAGFEGRSDLLRAAQELYDLDGGPLTVPAATRRQEQA